MENPGSGNLPGGNVANESSREYVEWLSTIDTTGGVLRFLARSRDFPVKTSEGGGCDQRSPQAILQATMASRRVQEAIRDETLAREWPREAVETEAQQMLDVMGHNFHLNSVRFVGFPVLSVVKAFWHGQKIKLMKKTKPVFLPGLLKDISGTYDLSFYVMGTVMTLSGVICLPLRWIAAHEKRRKMATAGDECEVKPLKNGNHA